MRYPTKDKNLENVNRRLKTAQNSGCCIIQNMTLSVKKLYISLSCVVVLLKSIIQHNVGSAQCNQ